MTNPASSPLEAAQGKAAEAPSQLEEKLLRAVALLAVPVAAGAGWLGGAPYSILALAAVVLIMAVLFIWKSLISLETDSGLTLEEALTLAAPSAEEEQKRAVLRALKDLDHEKALGTVSNDDYQSMKAHFRDEARRLLALSDEQLEPYRKRALALLDERLASEGEPPEKRQQQKLSSSPKAKKPRKSKTQQGSNIQSAPREEQLLSADAQSSRCCPSCEKANDDDARFCKHCGAAMTTSSEPTS